MFIASQKTFSGTRQYDPFITARMESLSLSKRYRGRSFGRQEMDQIRELIRSHSQASRQQLSYRVCELSDWRKFDGGLTDTSCRVALLRMRREGLLELPVPRHKANPYRSFARAIALQP